ncbi:MAG: gliding motility-associated ABC transporter ATP-binding subunit GldA [Cytophagales bacterium]
MSVQITNLTKLYGEQKAVDNISFSVAKGEIVGFLGPNGAGKSTTMKIATCFIPPTLGEIKVCGFDVTKQALEVKKRVGYLPEHNPLYTEMYIKEYLHFIGSLYGLHGKVLDAKVAEMIKITGLSPEKHKKIGELSKGYRQRTGLAAALIHNPEVLILDEPTTGLDPNQVVEIRQLIKEIGKEKTVILSTHIMQEVEAMCSRVIIINQGKIVADNSVSNIAETVVQKAFKIVLQFENNVQIADLQMIENVESIKELGNIKFELIATKDIRNQLFKLASERNWSLVELKLEETTLESVFQQLTKI